MLFRNSMRPAFACASAMGQARNNRVQNDALMYDAGSSETEDFGAFNSSGSGAKNNGNQRKSPKQGLKTSAIIVAAAAVVALVLLIVLVVAIVANSDKDIKFENNSFVSSCNEDGIYSVFANGKKIAEFENKIHLVIADDRSFAYIIEESDDGYRVALTDGKKTSDITATPVTKILATAGLTPGVVWLDADNGIYHYTQSRGEERITRDVDLTGANTDMHFFHISADAETVVYTRLDDENTAITHLCVYKDSSETKFQKNMYPVAVSDDGSIIYAYASRDGVTNSLYALPFNDEYDRFHLSENFLSIVDVNTEGNEVVFTTKNDTDSDIATYVVSFDVDKLDEVAQPMRIATGAIFRPISVKGDVARFASFADTYFESIIPSLEIINNEAPVYYLDKKFNSRRISKFAGKFDTKGDYFYYINNENNLFRVELGNEDSVSEKIAEDIVDFAVTQKGNVYWLDDISKLMFYNTSKEKKTRIADNVEGISMHIYSNTLYFTLTEAVSIYQTEEGSEKDVAKFDSGSITGLPQFVNPEYKRTFAGFYDQDNLEWVLYYTSNGRSFKKIGVFESIDGMFAIEDIIDDSTPETPPEGEGDENGEGQ